MNAQALQTPPRRTTSAPRRASRTLVARDGTKLRVDAQDYPLLARHVWYPVPWNSPRPRYVTRQKTIVLTLNHLVYGDVPEGLVVIHLNGDLRDLRRANLAAVPYSVANQRKGNIKRQGATTSQFTGVRRSPPNRWLALIGQGYERIYLGCFEDEEEAARAYDRKALELWGPYARFNFPERMPKPEPTPAVPLRPLRTEDGARLRVDAEDRPLLCRHTWALRPWRDGQLRYATQVAGQVAFLHELVHGDILDEALVLHLDRDIRDNRRGNLVCGAQAASEGIQAVRKGRRPSPSQYRGVSLQEGFWCANITYQKQRHFLGAFEDEDEAALAYDQQARKLYRKRAVLNFPDGKS